MRHAAACTAGIFLLLCGGGHSFAQTGTSTTSTAAAQSAGRGVSMPWAQSPWVKGFNSTVRLVAGANPRAGARALVAGIEIRMTDGWKTYWRHPGDDGGIAPTLDWSKSGNLAAARLAFPAPERLKGLTGYSIGYKGMVMLPVDIDAVDPTKPVELVLALEYGICREICVPAEARLQVTLPASAASLPAELAAALGRVPRAPERRLSTDPALKSASAVLTGPAPHLLFDIASGHAAKPDLFVEMPGGGYLPVPVRLPDPAPGAQRYRVNLKGVDDITGLTGKPLRLTMTAADGGAEATWTLK